MIRRINPGQKIDANYLNGLSKGISGASSIDGVSTNKGRVLHKSNPSFGSNLFWATIVTSGPGGGSDLTNNNYWVRPLAIDGSGYNLLGGSDTIVQAEDFVNKNYLSEIGTDRNYQVNDIVLVSTCPTSSGWIYTIVATSNLTPPDSSFWAQIISSTQDGTNYRWTYLVQKVVLTGSGFGTWTVPSSGSSNSSSSSSSSASSSSSSSSSSAYITAYNSIETMNLRTGTMGTGVVSTDLPYGLLPAVPAPAGAVVRVWYDSTNDNYSFQYENSTGGSC